MNLSIQPLPTLVAFVISAVVMVLILLTQRWHGRWSYDSTKGVQKIHQGKVPRIGGIALFTGVWITGYLLSYSIQDLLNTILIVTAIAFSFGLMEDLTKKVSVAIRMWATLLPGIVAYFLTGYSLSYFGIAPIDWVLQWTALSVLFTAFAICGITHAVNMIDGYNGLAAWSSIWILLGLWAISSACGDSELAMISLIFVGATAGFLLLNWPCGKVFLGDGGSYFLGASIACLCVLLVLRNPTVSPFACLVLCSYPIIETLYSIWRRFKLKKSSGNPDRLHLHQLIGEKLIYPALSKRRSTYGKSATTGFAVSLFCIPTVIMALALYDQQKTLIVLFFALTFGYIMVYITVSKMSDGLSKVVHLAANEVFTEEKTPQQKSDGGRV
jgi:UDP-N-acetylmuramyl pentapeptide phosphotransferase/UDP-N-acetylglucosamine-1-phosphate transferase